MSTPEGQGKFAVQALEILTELSTMVEREAYLPMISSLSRLSENSLAKQLDKFGENEKGYKESQEVQDVTQRFTLKPSTSKYYKASRYLIFTIFAYNSLDYFTEDISHYLKDKEHIAIYDFARELATNNIKLNLEALKELEGNGEAKNIYEGNFESIPDDCREQMLNDCFITLKKDFLDIEMQELTNRLEEEQNIDQQSLLRSQIAEINKQIIDLKRRKNGK